MTMTHRTPLTGAELVARKIRIAVGSPKEMHASVWTVWTQADDLYGAYAPPGPTFNGPRLPRSELRASRSRDPGRR